MEESSNSEQHSTQSRVAPTNLRQTDIDKFGQGNTPSLNKIIGNSYNENIQVNSNSKYINIGKVPPSSSIENLEPTQPQIKLQLKNLLFTLLIIVCIVAIGGVLYYLLSTSKTRAALAVQTKNLTVPVNAKLSMKLEDYGKFKKVKSSNCILDLKAVNVQKPGIYQYFIECGVNRYKGTIKVINSKPSNNP